MNAELIGLNGESILCTVYTPFLEKWIIPFYTWVNPPPPRAPNMPPHFPTRTFRYVGFRAGTAIYKEEKK